MKLIVFLALAIPLVLSLIITSDVPLCLWSNTAVFTGQNIEASESLDKHQVAGLLRNIMGQHAPYSTLKKYLSSEFSTPEVLVLYLEPKIRTDILSSFSSSFSRLKAMLFSAKSSLTAPFVDVQGTYEASILDLASKTHQNNGKIIYIGKGSALLPHLKTKTSNAIQVASPANLEAELETYAEIFTNGKPDLIIVHLDQTADTQKEKFDQSNMMIEKTQQFIEKKTDNFVSVYTALVHLTPEQTELSRSQAKRAVFETFQVPNNTNNNTNNTNDSNFFFTYFGGWFWEVLVLALLAAPILVIGIYQIEGIQSPDRFPKVKGH